MGENIKVFKDCEVGDTLWLFWDLQPIQECVITRKVNVRNTDRFWVHVDTVGELYPHYKPEWTKGGNYYTTLLEAQQARNVNLKGEINRLKDSIEPIQDKILNLTGQLLNV